MKKITLNNSGKWSLTSSNPFLVLLVSLPCHSLLLLLLFFRKTKKELEHIRKNLDDKRVLHDLVVGLRHLHELNIVHRDLKPQNVLISKQNKVLISDFGLCKKLEAGRTSFNTSALGTIGWTAPEALNRKSVKQEMSRMTKSVDIFSLGCIFYFILTKGKHPFGSYAMRQGNILQGKRNLSGLGGDMISIDLISRMTAQKPEERPTPEEILIHPFFWNDAKRLNFLQDASDRFEIEGKTSPPVISEFLTFSYLFCFFSSSYSKIPLPARFSPGSQPYEDYRKLLVPAN